MPGKRRGGFRESSRQITQLVFRDSEVHHDYDQLALGVDVGRDVHADSFAAHSAARWCPLRARTSYERNASPTSP